MYIKCTCTGPFLPVEATCASCVSAMCMGDMYFVDHSQPISTHFSSMSVTCIQLQTVHQQHGWIKSKKYISFYLRSKILFTIYIISISKYVLWNNVCCLQSILFYSLAKYPPVSVSYWAVCAAPGSFPGIVHYYWVLSVQHIPNNFQVTPPSSRWNNHKNIYIMNKEYFILASNYCHWNWNKIFLCFLQDSHDDTE